MTVIPIYPVYSEANCYIIASGNKCAVVDPGAYPQKIIKTAADYGLTIDKVLLTHCHFDHIMAVNELCHTTGAQLYIHKDDKAALYEPCLNLSSMIGRDYALDADIPVNTLSGGDTVYLGEEKIAVLHTPGHTPGSVCYYFDNIMLTGDTLFALTIGRTDFPGSNHGDMLRSLKKLASLTVDYKLYPGHSAETTLFYEKNHNPYLQG